MNLKFLIKIKAKYSKLEFKQFQHKKREREVTHKDENLFNAE